MRYRLLQFDLLLGGVRAEIVPDEIEAAPTTAAEVLEHARAALGRIRLVIGGGSNNPAVGRGQAMAHGAEGTRIEGRSEGGRNRAREGLFQALSLRQLVVLSAETCVVMQAPVKPRDG